MASDFCVFILTHGRADRVATYKTLRDCGYSGRIYLVVDDLDSCLGEYRHIYPNEVVVFDKKKYFDFTDTGDNKAEMDSVVFARNAIFDIARRVGVKYFLMLDDDYDAFYYKFTSDLEYDEKKCLSLDSVFREVVDYLASTNALSIAFAQNGDFMGGHRSTYGRKVFASRKCMNTFFCATDRLFSFLGRLNDDVNTYSYRGHCGDLFLTISNISIHQKKTQSNRGGLTDAYLRDGTYQKSFYSVMWCPSFIKIAALNSKNKRIHHKTKWGNACPMIVRESVKKAG